MVGHPHIIKVEAVHMNSPPFLVALENMKNGDLRSYLKRCAAYKDNPKAGVKAGLNASPQALQIAATKLCSALAFLESVKVVHRDLAARNVLVGETIADVKLADFGMSRTLNEKVCVLLRRRLNRNHLL